MRETTHLAKFTRQNREAVVRQSHQLQMAEN
jgi:hypothetical protein